MFGESLPDVFDSREEQMLSSAGLLLVIGTSLKVAPYSEIPRRLPSPVPRVLVNRELVGNLGTRESDICLLGDCDAGLREVVRQLDCEGELESVWKDAMVRKEKSSRDSGWDDKTLTLEVCIARAAEKM
jgi:NAD-dependent histone deacetylase SIR2